MAYCIIISKNLKWRYLHLQTEVKLEFKTILSTIEFKNLLKRKEELLKMLPQGKMNLLSIVNSKFESLYSKEERSSIKVTLDDIDKIINIARIPLPEMLKSVWRREKSIA